jgi:hypothetical protein
MARVLLQSDILSMRVITEQTTPEVQVCVTTFDFTILLSSFVSGLTDQALVTAFDTAIAADFKGIMNTTCFYRGVILNYLAPKPPPASVFNNTNNGAGTGGANAMPTQVRGLTRRLTAFGGPSNRGRIYWPFPWQAAATSAGAPTGAYQGDLTTAWGGIAPVGGVTYTGGGGTVTLLPIIWHRKTGTYTYITSYVNGVGFATQKKSGFYGRTNTSPI